MRNKMLLLGTLGGSWQLIPELLGFTNPEQIKLFAQRDDLTDVAVGLPLIEEVWLVTTAGDVAGNSVKKLREWQQLMGHHAPTIRIWAPEGVEDLASQAEVDAMRELIWRLALHATEQRGVDAVCYCLAGGRKTMSSDLQQAASLFGGRQLLHLIDAGRLPDHIGTGAIPQTFATSLAKSDAEMFSPVVIDRNLPKAELLAFRGENDGQTINSERFQLFLAPDSGAAFPVTLRPDLQQTVEERRKRAKNLLFHYASSLSADSATVSFQALNVLPPSIISGLKTRMIGLNPDSTEEEMAWLRMLPKVDLHCHLGGVSSAEDLIEIAAAMQPELDPWLDKLTGLITGWRQLVKNGSVCAIRQAIMHPSETRLKDTFARLAKETGVPGWAVCAAFINAFRDEPQLLDSFIFAEYIEPEKYTGIDIKGYEPLGDLQGSTLLQTETAIRTTCRLLLKKCRAENIRYIEVRCSPINYTRGGLAAEDVVNFIREELSEGYPEVCAGLIFIGSRHGAMSDCWRHVELAQQILANEKEQFAVPLVGFDLAGDEEFNAERFVPAFRPLFEQCLHITVHAGETRAAESIWQAVYTLNAERIGHGLKLKDNQKLLQHFLDRGISVEMCPSSNFQIVGFKDNYYPEISHNDVYPLKNYLDQGLKIFVNTDNPGISRTDATKELMRAARLTPGGLSRMDILNLIKNGFWASFAGYNLRRKLLLSAEKQVLDILRQEPG